jgi:glycosyltransferase involved in cell wall biosynthesis
MAEMSEAGVDRLAMTEIAVGPGECVDRGGDGTARNIVLIVHYFAPLSVAGSKRVEAMAKYFARAGRNVTVLTTRKTDSDGAFTEPFPAGATIIELGWTGRRAASGVSAVSPAMLTAMEAKRPRRRSLKQIATRWFGQIPDPRVPFAFGFISPALAPEAKAALRSADIIVASCPPWPILLAGLFAGRRFGKPVVLDYRDHFSACHEMPGSRLAKRVEAWLDKRLASRAHALVAVTDPMAEYYSAFQPLTSVIINGYDPEKIDAAQRTAPWAPRHKGVPLTIRYLGLITPGRIPYHLLAALVRLEQKGALRADPLVFEFYGDCGLLRDEIEAHYPSIRNYFRFLGPVPYAQALQRVVTADHLLFCENSVPPKKGQEASAAGILTTKLFEYLASGRPIIADIAPDALAATYLLEASDGHFVTNRTEAFEEYLTSDRFWRPQPVEVSPFVRSLSRESQALSYLAKLDALARGRAA